MPPGAEWWNSTCLRKSIKKWSINSLLADRKSEMVDLGEDRADSDACEGEMKGGGGTCGNLKWIKN